MTKSSHNDGNDGNDGNHNCQLGRQDESLQERLSAFVDGELPVDEFEQIRRHIVSCKSCSRTVEQFRTVDSQLTMEMSRPHAALPSLLSKATVNKQPDRELVLSNAAPSRHWLATGSLAAAGVAVLAAFAAGTFSSGGDSDPLAQRSKTGPFSPDFMTNVVAPLGEMALSNDVCKNQQKQVARTLDLELRLLRLDTKNISNDEDKVQEINDEIDALMKQIKQLGYAVDTPDSELPAL